MKISNYIINMGRVVAYYPGLRHITKSVTASILLCQFLYWSDKSRDKGWIYKDNTEIEEETGLTYYEQLTAKKSLSEIGLLEYEFKRLDHTSRFRVNAEKLHEMWIQYFGDDSSEDTTKKVPENELAKEMLEKAKELEKNAKPRQPIEKKGTLVDAVVDMRESPGLKVEAAKNAITSKIEKKLRILIQNNKDWLDFVDFAYTRDTLYNEKIEKFLHWFIYSGQEVSYCPPRKMKVLWPQAFTEDERNKPRKDFVKRTPVPVEENEEEYAPMPKNIGKERKLF